MKPSLLLFSILFISGCATSYKSNGFQGGYSESQYADDVYEVTFKGNSHTSADRAKDFAMLRSAELCQKNGYSYFVVIDKESSTSISASTSAGQSLSTYPAKVNGTTYSHTINTGGQTTIRSKPSSSVTVKMLRNKPADGACFEAAFIIKSLKSQYGIE